MRLTFATLLLAACGSWPRYADLEDDPEIAEPGQDPRDLIAIDWELTTESELLVRAGARNNNPANVRAVSLGVLTGVQVQASLDGVGWDSSFDPLTMSATCDGERVEVPREPGRPGDWTGDLDFVRFDVDADAGEALLCARAAFGRDDIGFDLLLYELDACGLPGAPARADSDSADPILGADRAGPVDGWIAPVQAGRSYAVLTAGFLAPDPMATYPYHVGLAIVPAKGGGERCPYLPSEASTQ